MSLYVHPLSVGILSIIDQSFHQAHIHIHIHTLTQPLQGHTLSASNNLFLFPKCGLKITAPPILLSLSLPTPAHWSHLFSQNQVRNLQGLVQKVKATTYSEIIKEFQDHSSSNLKIQVLCDCTGHGPWSHPVLSPQGDRFRSHTAYTTYLVWD